MTILEYNYKHEATRGTTGYFSCVPDFEASWPQALELLSERPCDAWLYDHAIRQFAELDNAVKAGFVTNAINALKEDLSCVHGWSPDFLRQFLEDCAEAAVLPEMPDLPPFLRGDALAGYDSLCEAINANIHHHIPLGATGFKGVPLPETAYMDNIGNFAKAKESGPPKWNDQVERQSLKALAARAMDALAKADLLAGPEMRHEASLSPIALLRAWHLETGVFAGPSPNRLTGVATAYGRGFSLAKARVSCLMEIVERASAHAIILENGEFYRQPQLATPIRASSAELAGRGMPFYTSVFSGHERRSVFWIGAKNSAGEECLVPASEVFLFLNLPEKPGKGGPGSTGLASGASRYGARLKALLEALERHAHATMPHDPSRCFTPQSRDSLLQSLLDDYRARGIHIYFEDITTENGVPAYRCFVTGRDGSLAQATGADLNGREAALSALGETSWPYNYSLPAPLGKASARLNPSPPPRFLEELPDYATGQDKSDLRLLESIFRDSPMRPLYVDLTRDDLKFPVCRCIVPNLEIDADYNRHNCPGPRLFRRICERV